MVRLMFGLLMSLLASFALKAEPRLLDRLVLEVNGKSYTQRQIEIYCALRTIAMGEPLDKALPSPEGWTAAVETFKNEILVYSNIESDPQRMESFQPDNKALQEAEILVQKARFTHSEFQDLLQRHQVTDTEVIRNLLTFFRVQSYVRSRVQLVGAGGAGALSHLSIDAKSEWFLSLQRMTPFRLYDKAKEFRVLQQKRP